MQPNRVCLRLTGGRLLPASAVGQANFTSLTRWVPVPDTQEGRLLALEDDGRPLGTHPAVWYGWPRNRPDIRDEWAVSNGNETRKVRAYSIEHAAKESGFDLAVIQSVLMKKRWY